MEHDCPKGKEKEPEVRLQIYSIILHELFFI